MKRVRNKLKRPDGTPWPYGGVLSHVVSLIREASAKGIGLRLTGEEVRALDWSVIRSMTIVKLIDRLRTACTGHPHAKIAWPHQILHEAANALASSQEEIARLTRERDEALRLADWSAVENNTIVNQVWGLLGGPDATREGGQSLVNRVKERLEEIARLRKALEPFAELSKTMDAITVDGQRRLQPDAAVAMSDDVIAALITPDETALLTDGRMAFGGPGHPSPPAKVTMGDFRAAARALASKAGAA